MATVTCPACRGIYAEHFANCIHCNAPRPGGVEPPAPPPPAALDLRGALELRGTSPAVPSPPPLPAPAPPRPAAPPRPECPCCNGAPGRGSVRLERREYEGSNWRGARRWTVRWVDIPGVCARCMRDLEIRRFAADVLCNVPFILLFILLVVTDSKLFLVLLLTYGLILFKWSWGLGYVWADLMLYGWKLDSSLGRFEPAGDAGTTRFPAGMLHVLVRLGFIPGLVVVLAMVGSVFVKRPGGDAAEASVTQRSNPLERARAWLESAEGISVPVDPRSLAMVRDGLAREDVYFYTVYARGAVPPRGLDYQLMTGPELLATFLRTEGHDTDSLTLQGSGLPLLLRRDAKKISTTMALPGPVTTPVLKSP